MKRWGGWRVWLFPLFSISLLLFFSASAFSSPELKKDWFVVNGERFFVKGIGYSNCRPHESPNRKPIDLAQCRKEFQLIREAGFNTLRTWKPLSLEELQVAHEFGLQVIQGTWIEYQENYTDPERIVQVANQLKAVVIESQKAPNVLLYLVGNEPQPAQVFSVGRENTDRFFTQLRDSIHKISPQSPVAMSNWVQCDFLNDSMWDVSALNIYIYNPDSVSHAMGYRGYVNWLKRTRATDRPLLITEMGLSASPNGPGKWGYGGNSEEEQKEGVLYMLKEAIAGGAVGTCAFEWIDEWWKNYNHGSDWDVHEPGDAEEWFGMAYYDEQGMIHFRPLYQALKEFNQAIVIEPKDLAVISKSCKVEVTVEPDVTQVDVALGEGPWIVLRRVSDHWFGGELSVKNIPDGKTTLKMRASKPNPQTPKEPLVLVFEKEQTLYVNNAKKMTTPYRVETLLDQDTYYTKSRLTPIRIRFKVTDAKGKPVAKQKVDTAIYEPVLNQQIKKDAETDAEGIATDIYHVNEEGILTISCGVPLFPQDAPQSESQGGSQETPKDPRTLSIVPKYGDCKHVPIFYQKKSSQQK